MGACLTASKGSVFVRMSVYLDQIMRDLHCLNCSILQPEQEPTLPLSATAKGLIHDGPAELIPWQSTKEHLQQDHPPA